MNPPATGPQDDYSPQYYRRLGQVAGTRIASHRWRMKWLDRMLPCGGGDRVVDLGAGAGTVAIRLAGRGCEVHSVDLSANAIAYCRRQARGLPNLHFEQCDAGDCRHLASDSFDAATCMDLIEHVNDATMRRVFREARRLLRPGGLLYVYSPNRRHWIEILKAHNLFLRQDPSHTNVRTIPQVVAALKEQSFDIVRLARPTSMIPVVRALEWLWARQPLWPRLAVYRVCVLARKSSGGPQ